MATQYRGVRTFDRQKKADEINNPRKRKKTTLIPAEPFKSSQSNARPLMEKASEILAKGDRQANTKELKVNPALLPFFTRMLKRENTSQVASGYLQCAYSDGVYKFDALRPHLEAIFGNKKLVATLGRAQAEERFDQGFYKFLHSIPREFSEDGFYNDKSGAGKHMTYLIERIKGGKFAVYHMDYSKMTGAADLLHDLLRYSKITSERQPIADFLQAVLKRLLVSNELIMNNDDPNQKTKRKLIKSIMETLDRAVDDGGIKLKKWAHKAVLDLWE